MATAVCKDPELRCTICLEKFNLPKILSCLHTFCEPSIQSYVQNCAGRKHQLFPMPFVPHEDWLNKPFCNGMDKKNYQQIIWLHLFLIVKQTTINKKKYTVIRANLPNLTQSQKLAEAVQEHGSRKEKFVNVEKTRMVIENDFERLCSTFNFSETSKRYDLHIEDKLKNVLNWSKISSLNFQQSDEDPLTDIKTTLCWLGCFNDYTVFQYSFSLGYALQVSPPFLLPKSQSKWRIEFHVINNNLGIYVNCISSDNSDWPLDVSVELSLVNQVDRKKTL